MNADAQSALNPEARSPSDFPALPVQNTMRSRIPGGFDMNVNILTSGYWPSYPIIDAKMPAELNDYQQARSAYALHSA